MTIVAIDIVDLATGELTAKGHKFTRRATVENPVEQSGRVDDAARVFEAMHDTGIPEIGDSHPNVAACLLTKIRCVALESNYLQLDLIYETTQLNYRVVTLGLEDISMESSLIQVETTKDFDGNNLSALSYQYGIGTPNPANPVAEDGTPNLLSANLTLRSELPVVPAYIPAKIYTIRKRLSSIDEDELEALNDAYQGFVNNATWRTYDPRTWLCMGINWRSTDRRTTFNIDVRFQFKFDAFDAEVVFRDPYNGKVPGDVFSQVAAFESYRVQREANFDQLLIDIGVT